MVLIEIACGTAPREHTLSDLRQLRSVTVANTEETLALIEREEVQDSGCGAIDLLLLGSVLLTSDAVLWTLDRNLRTLAARFEVSFSQIRMCPSFDVFARTAAYFLPDPGRHIHRPEIPFG
jgi:hypothetical protein